MRTTCRNLLMLTVGLVFAALTPLAPSSAAPNGPSSTSDSPDCGAPIAKPSGGTWRCTFSDGFSGSALDATKWTPMTTAATGGKFSDCRVDTPQTIRVSDGTLKLTVLDTGSPFVCSSPSGEYTTQYAAGAVSTGRKFSQAYGRFEIRAAMPDARVAGLHSAIWMWPQERRYGSSSGEIDINEWRSGLPDRGVPTVHYVSDSAAGPKTVWNCVVDRPQDFHNYVLEWTRSTLTFIHDGKVCLSHEWQPASPLRKPQPIDEPFFLILNQNLGVGQNALDPAVTPLPASMVVDHVRIWS